ncbi:MAG: ester cyclase [Flavobacteriales bacterium]|nr:ester cyclase [Flavobacteriales bacterium]
MKKTLPYLLLLATLVWSCGGHDPEHDKMMAEHKAMLSADSAKHAEMDQMKQATQRFYDMWLAGKSDGIEEFVAENFVSHNPIPGITSTGIQQMKDMIALSSQTFTDNKVEDMSMTADGDRVVAHYKWKAVNTGSMDPSMPATNKPIDVHGVDIMRFENGKVVEHWGYMEEMKMMQQLGMMPGDEAGSKK